MRFATDARIAFGLLASSVLALGAFVVVGFGDLPSRALRSPDARPAKSPPVAGTEFVDVTTEVGLAGFKHDVPDGVRSIQDAVAPGLGLLDLDDDRDLDLVLLAGPGGRSGVSIFVNRFSERRELLFEDVTAEMGFEWAGAAQGVCAGDVDMDGDIDLFVSAIGGNVLLMNLLSDDGELGFYDGTDDAGVRGGRWYWREDADPGPPSTMALPAGHAFPAGSEEVAEFSTGASFGDFDADSDLDLYVANYVCYFEERYERLLRMQGERTNRNEPIQFQPRSFEPQPDRLYRNLHEDGDLFFSEITRLAHARDELGRGLGARFMLIDTDIYADLFVVNDQSENVYLHNVAVKPEDDVDFRRRFEETTSNVGLSERKSGMGIARGDADGDGDLDILTTNWRLERASLFLFHRDKIEDGGVARYEPTFEQRVLQAGQLAESTYPFVGWGCVFFDYDNDGDEDVFIGNGFTSPSEGAFSCTPEKPLLFLNDGNGRFADVTSSAGVALAKPYAARGVVTGDLDQDGDLDLVLAQNNGPVVVLENRLPANGNRWLSLALSMLPRRADAVNVQVMAEVDRRPRLQELTSGASYLSQGPFEVHFGLGAAAQADVLRITWPSLSPPPLVFDRVPAGRKGVDLEGRLEPR